MNRKAVTFLIVLSILLALVAPAFSATVDSSSWSRYNAEKKEPLLGVGCAWLLPTLGHWYGGNWGRGVPFLIAELVGLGMYVAGATATTHDLDDLTSKVGQAETGLLIYAVAKIWEMFDAYLTTDNYNTQLKKKYGLPVSLLDGDPVVNLSYSF